MIKFTNVSMQDFRSFVGKHDLPLDDKGLFLVRGSNLDTAGESGAGKSTIFLAISFALGCSPFSGKDLTNWHADKTQVILSLMVDDEPVEVHRGAINKIVYTDREVTGAKQIESELDRIFGIDANQRATVLYKNQGLGDYFLNKSNGEKRDFIVTVLGIDEFEKQIAATNKELSDETVAQQLVARELELLNSNVDILTKKLALFQPPVQPAWSDTLPMRLEENDLKTKEISDSLATWEAEDAAEAKFIKDEIALVQEQIANCRMNPLVVEIDGQIKQAESDRLLYAELIVVITRKISEAKVVEHKRAALEQKIVNLQDFLKTADVGACPTCKQKWDSEALIKLKELELSLSQHELSQLPDIDLEKLGKEEDEAREKLKAEDIKIKGFRDTKVRTINELQQSLLDTVKQMQSYSTKNTESIKIAKVHISELTKERYALLKEQNDTLLKKNEYNKALVAYETNKANTESQLAALLQDKATKDRENDKLLKDIAFLNEKVDFTKGFLYNIFHDMLEELTAETNAILAKIPNVAHITVSFDSERETKKGDVKQELVAKINVNGSERPLKSGCSGGMISAVQLATDLALRKLLSRRAQKDWGILMIDEQFGGLDLVSKTCCMEVLKDFSQNCLVMVIDHHTEINEYSDQIIEVEYQNGRSHLA